MEIQMFEYDTLSCYAGEELKYNSVQLVLANLSYDEAEMIMELAKKRCKVKVTEDKDNG